MISTATLIEIAAKVLFRSESPRYFEKRNQGSLLLFWNGKCNAIISIAIHVLSTGRDRILPRFAAWTGFSMPIFDVMGEGMYEV